MGFAEETKTLKGFATCPWQWAPELPALLIEISCFASSVASPTLPPNPLASPTPEVCSLSLWALVSSPAKQMEFTERAVSCQCPFLYLRKFPFLIPLATLQKVEEVERQGSGLTAPPASPDRLPLQHLLSWVWAKSLPLWLSNFRLGTEGAPWLHQALLDQQLGSLLPYTLTLQAYRNGFSVECWRLCPRDTPPTFPGPLAPFPISHWDFHPVTLLMASAHPLFCPLCFEAHP